MTTKPKTLDELTTENSLLLDLAKSARHDADELTRTISFLVAAGHVSSEIVDIAKQLTRRP